MKPLCRVTKARFHIFCYPPKYPQKLKKGCIFNDQETWSRVSSEAKKHLSGDRILSKHLLVELQGTPLHSHKENQTTNICEYSFAICINHSHVFPNIDRKYCTIETSPFFFVLPPPSFITWQRKKKRKALLFCTPNPDLWQELRRKHCTSRYLCWGLSMCHLL